MTGSEHGDALSSLQGWQGATCVPRSGNGTLARVGRVVLLVSESDKSDVAPLLDHVESVARNGSEARQLVRGFALLLSSMAGDPPPFLAMAPLETGIAVFASGAASVFVDGEEVTGRDSLAWAERVFPWPVREVEGRVDDAAVAISGLFDLRQGVVNAGGFAFVAKPETGATPAEPVAEDAGETTPQDAIADTADQERPVAQKVPEPSALQAPKAQDTAGARPAPPAPPAAPEEQDTAGARRPAPPQTPEPPDLPPRAERPVRPAAEEEAPPEFESIVLGPRADEVDDGPSPLPIISHRRDLPVSSIHVSQVRGVFCKNHHFNDPRMLFCSVCGINMVQQTPVLVDGTRPPLGVVVLDDGSVFQLDSNYLIGRDPESDDLVRSGRYRGIQVSDNQNMISRIHARLELRTWDVVLVDNASTNGTFFAPLGSAEWEQLPQSGDQLLAPGTRIRIGHRTLAFNTHRGN